MNEKTTVPADKTAGERAAAAQANLKKQIDEAMQAARTLRDEIRVQVHLAGMDAKDRWAQIEPSFYDAEKLAGDISDATKTAALKVAVSFRQFRDSIKRHATEMKH